MMQQQWGCQYLNKINSSFTNIIDQTQFSQRLLRQQQTKSGHDIDILPPLI